MRLGEALDILYGELINTPYISAFSGATQKLEYVESGNLFFVKNLNDVKEAINRGAYGIVFEGDLEIQDKEIAWIKVLDISKSIKRFIRYILLQSQYSLVFLTQIELSFAKNLNIGLPILHGNTKEDILGEIFRIYQIHEKEEKDSKNSMKEDSIKPFFNVLFTSIKDLEDLDIYKCYSLQYARQNTESNHNGLNIEVPLHYKQTCIVLSYSLFESKIIWNNTKIILRLPYIFLPFVESLCATIMFLKEKYWSEISGNVIKKSYMVENIDIANLRLEELELYFIDSNARFSNTAKKKSILFCKNLNIFECKTLKECDLQYTAGIRSNAITFFNSKEYCNDTNILTKYLKLYASHLQLLSCYPKNIRLPKTTKKNIMLPYPHIEHLCQILLKMQYHLAIVYGISRKSFDKTMLMPKQNKKQEEKNRLLYNNANKNSQNNIFDFYGIKN